MTSSPIAHTRLRPSKDGWRVVVGRMMAVTAMLLASYGMVTLVVIGRSDFITRDYAAHNALLAFGFGALTWIAIRRQPRNGAVWVAGWAASFTAIYLASTATALVLVGRYGFEVSIATARDFSPADLPGGVALILNPAMWAFIPGFGLVMTLGLLLFPDGRLPSPKWRWVALASLLVTAALSVVVAWLFRPGSTVPLGLSSNEYPGIGRLVDPLFGALYACSAMCGAGLVVGYRRSTGVRRQQYRWIAWGGATLTVSVISTSLSQPNIPNPPPGWVLVVGLFGVAALIASYGVAVTRYRLYEIDLVISRSLVYGMLAAFIGTVYVLVVVVIGSALGSGAGGLALSIAATAAIAAAFEPVRVRAQRWANRLVYGQRATPYSVLSDLMERLADAEEGHQLLSRMAELLADGTGASRATVWLGPVGDMEPAASWPTDPTTPALIRIEDQNVFPVMHDEEVVGALQVEMPPGVALSSAQRSLLSNLAGSAGLVLGYRRLNDSLAERARELAESRNRLVDAEDEERRRLERELHDSVEERILALKMEIERMTRWVAEQKASDLSSLLDPLAEEAQDALEEVRALAKGIYPPMLESEGLVAGLSTLAASAPVEVILNHEGLTRYPVDVEAAVYFDVSEAVTNAIKHGRPPIRVALVERGGLLRFVVTDAGPGFDPSETERRSGLENMRDRLEAVGGQLSVASRLGDGTTVTGEVPLAVAGV